MTARHALPLDANTPSTTCGEISVEQAGRIAAAVRPEKVIVIGRDSDEPGINTAAERGWSVLVHWSGGVPYRRRGQPATARRIADELLRRDTILLSGAGLDELYGSDRTRRMKRALVIGQDYSGSGICGVGAKTVDGGKVDAVLGTDWSDTDTLRRALSRFLKAGANDKIVTAVATRLQLGLKTMEGAAVETFDVAEYHRQLETDPVARANAADTRPVLVWPGPGPAPRRPKATPGGHPMGPYSRTGRKSSKPSRLRHRPIRGETDILARSREYGPDQPRGIKRKQTSSAATASAGTKRTKTSSSSANVQMGAAAERDKDVEMRGADAGTPQPGADAPGAEAETGDAAEQDSQSDHGGGKASAPPASKKARQMTYDYGPASTQRLDHNTWERHLVPQCFIRRTALPASAGRPRKRHLSGAAQARKRRELRPWRRRQKKRILQVEPPQTGATPTAGPTRKSTAAETRASDKASTTAKPETPTDRAMPRDPPAATTTTNRVYPFSYGVRLLHFCVQQSLPWLERALSALVEDATTQSASARVREERVAELARESAKRDGLARLVARIARPEGGREQQDTRVSSE